jgi:2-amino-4-hydroxy-6-hydroxymethyldihydropteridine diphosphokinase
MGDDRPRAARLDLVPAPSLILIGLGANLDSLLWGAPRETMSAALAALESAGVGIIARSGWYRSAPLPPSDQPWYVNAVASVTTSLGAADLLALMQMIERRFGRVRGARNAARVLDLDLLDYRGKRVKSPELTLPHPRLHLRRFVLEPLAEIAPEWVHPIRNASAGELLAQLEGEQAIEKLTC